MLGGTLADWVQIAGLAINAGLLVGLIVQIAAATRARREDVRLESKRATLDAWARLVGSLRDVEAYARTHFGRGPLDQERAARFIDQVVHASGRRARQSPDGADDDAAIIRANEALRSVLNESEDFAIGVDVGAYDLETARRVGGWRLARLVVRHRGYIQVLRDSLDDSVYGSLEAFASDFLAVQGLTLDTLPIMAGHGDDLSDVRHAVEGGTPAAS